MARSATFALALFLGAILTTGEASAQCDPLWVKRVSKAFRSADPATKQAARVWVRDFKRADDELAKGMLSTVLAISKEPGEKDLRALLVAFMALDDKDFPFAGTSKQDRVRDMYRAVATLTSDNTYEHVDGVKGAIGNLLSDNSPSNQKGALLELKVARDQFLKVGDPAKVHIQRVIIVPETNVTRRLDVAVDDAAAPPLLKGRLREAKNWPDGLNGEGANFGPLRHYADDEFPSDILLNAATGFQWYGVDLRKVLLTSKSGGVSDATIVLHELTKKFDEEWIVTLLGGSDIADARKSAFVAAWNSGLVEYH